MADDRLHDPKAPAAALDFLRPAPVAAAFHVAPDIRAARRPSLACRWTCDRANRRLVSVWTRRRPEIVVGGA